VCGQRGENFQETNETYLKLILRVLYLCIRQISKWDDLFMIL